MKPLSTRAIALALGLTAVGVGNGWAGEQITWGSTLFVPDFTSAGASVPIDSSFVFELGAFTPGFDPSENPPEDWAANWQVLDRVNYDDSLSGALCTCAVSRRTVLESNTGNFIMTNQGYIWGYNCAQPDGEWILITTPGWTWPDAAGTFFGTTWVLGANSVAVLGTLGNPGADGFEMMTAMVEDAVVPRVTAASWMATNSTGSLGSDDDRDGLSNLLEFALGTDPGSNQSGAASPLVWELVDAGGQNFWQVRADRDPLAKATISLEASDDLDSWEAVDLDFGQAFNTDLPGHFQFRDPVAVGAGGIVRRFLRLRVSSD